MSQQLTTVLYLDSLLFGVVYSKRPGMGKSLYIQRLKELLKYKDPENKHTLARVPIHGPSVSPSAIMKFLVEDCSQAPLATYKQIIHLDLSHSVSQYYFFVQDMGLTLLASIALCSFQSTTACFFFLWK